MIVIHSESLSLILIKIISNKFHLLGKAHITQSKELVKSVIAFFTSILFGYFIRSDIPKLNSKSLRLGALCPHKLYHTPILKINKNFIHYE
jgi:hypothetical protein